jgi:uncharacterized protein (DUF362 family)/NAD-dependent dihydropyrimidine dehydrogenase PreA subunit
MDKVFLARCENYDYDLVEQNVNRIFDSFGGAQAILRGRKKVTVKVNLLLPKSPENAATTHPAVAAAVAKYFVSAGADVTIADSPGGPYNTVTINKVYDACGMREAAARSGAALNMDMGSHIKTFECESGVRAFDIINPVYDAEVVIDVAKMKTHSLAYFTGAVKNLFGTIAGVNKAAYHANLPKVEDFCEMLVDLCRTVAPDFSIIDGIIGMEGDGPSGGNPKHAGVIIGAPNPFAADLAAMRFCGLDENNSPVHRRGVQLGLISDIEHIGDDPAPVEPPFTPAMMDKKMWKAVSAIPNVISRVVGAHFRPYPIISDRCVGCGICAESCPGKALEIKNKKAVLSKKKCIKCYCCHELCRIEAIDLR